MVSIDKSTVERTRRARDKLRLMCNVNHEFGLYFGGLNPLAAVSIWRRVILPCSLYGCHTWGKLSLKEYEMLEISQRYFSKKIQGLPKNTPNAIARDTLGLISLEKHTEQQALIFLGKLCNASPRLIFKQLFLTRIGQYVNNRLQIQTCKLDTKSPIFHMLHLVWKYDLSREIDKYLHSSKFMSKQKWSDSVKEKIKTADNYMLLNELHSRLSLSRYLSIRSGSENHLWKLAQDCKDKFFEIATLIRIGAQPLTSRECPCGKVAYDIVKHVMLYCDINYCEREELFGNIIDVLDVEMCVKLWNEEEEILL